MAGQYEKMGVPVMKMKAVGRILLASLILLTAADTALAKKPPKGGDSGGGTTEPAPEPTPPPVKYHAVTVPEAGVARLHAINNWGQMVGQSQAGYGDKVFVLNVDAALGSVEFCDLNEVGGIWIDLDEVEEVVGWRVAIARDINDKGDIVGTATNGDMRRAYLYSNDVFYLLPSVPGYDREAISGRGVNNHGEVCGMVWDAAASQWLTVVWTWSDDRSVLLPLLPSPDLITKPTTLDMRISDDGVVVGHLANANDWFRYDSKLQTQDFYSGYFTTNSNSILAGLDSQNDVVRFTAPDRSDLTLVASSSTGRKIAPWINADGEVLFGETLSTMGKNKGGSSSNRIIYSDKSGKAEYYVVSDLVDRFFNFTQRNAGVMCASNDWVDPDGTGFGIIGTEYIENRESKVCVLIPRKP